VLAIVAGILAARHLKNTDDFSIAGQVRGQSPWSRPRFSRPSGSCGKLIMCFQNRLRSRSLWQALPPWDHPLCRSDAGRDVDFPLLQASHGPGHGSCFPAVSGEGWTSIAGENTGEDHFRQNMWRILFRKPRLGGQFSAVCPNNLVVAFRTLPVPKNRG
jgi:hypothetical protein